MVMFHFTFLNFRLKDSTYLTVWQHAFLGYFLFYIYFFFYFICCLLGPAFVYTMFVCVWGFFVFFLSSLWKDVGCDL